jgi:phage recombination protein Bet
MNALTKHEGGALALSESETIAVLQSSLYPGAAVESVKMVLGYCKAAGLDPMQKPVHIVPMWDSKAGRMRDVVMPGVNLYRTQAARTGQFAGMSEPEFGPDVTATIGGVQITYPDWCRVTVKRLLPNGSLAEFVAREFWIENYAVKGGKEKSIAPNAMWQRRPRGQVAKCAAAQALRIAFPENGGQPTAEEMEGKTLQADESPLDLPQIAPAELVAQARKAAAGGVAAYQTFWQGAGAANRKLLAGQHNDFKAQAQAADAARTVEAEVEPAGAPVDDDFVRDFDAEEQRGNE